MIRLYNEVMLNNIVFNNNNSIRFEFYNATGRDMACVLCRSVLLFQYNSTLLLGEESLPCYVLDVTEEQVDVSGMIDYLLNNKFSFHQFNGSPTLPKENSYYIFRIQGGPIDISVACVQIIKN